MGGLRKIKREVKRIGKQIEHAAKRNPGVTHAVLKGASAGATHVANNGIPGQ